MQGMAAGMGNCIQGLGGVLPAWMRGRYPTLQKPGDITAGDSVTLKASVELTTPIVGSSVTAYDQGTVAGRRVCAQYAAVPAATKVLGPALKSAATKTGTALAKTPLSGGALAGSH